MQFKEFALHTDILKALEKLHYEQVLPIQEQVIPEILKGRDVIVRSRTGSGKTASFAIPIVQELIWEEREPQAIILTPTRELALQIKEDFDNIGAYRRIKTVAIFGKQPYKFQIQDLKQRAHVVVGTPGRILDHLERETLKTGHIRYVIIDEADEMLNMGFIESVQSIFNYFPGNKITCLFSETTVNAAITHYAYEVKEKQKLSFLKQLLCKEQPASCIIFARTQEGVKTICDELYALDMCVDKLHGGMLQEDRIENIRDFKRGKIRILVATDVAARGIDVQDISHIINYDMPNQKETYLHRIGRTGRQRASGKAITLINEYDGERKAELEDYLGYPLEIRERGEISNQDVTKETIEPLTKPFALREDKGKEVHKDTMKLYLNGGKTKKIRAGDIVGAICEIQGVSAEDIGVIQIQDNQSYVDILNGKGKQVLKTLQQSTIKGKKLKVQKAKEQGE